MSWTDNVTAAAGGVLYWLSGGDRKCFPKGEDNPLENLSGQEMADHIVTYLKERSKNSERSSSDRRQSGEVAAYLEKLAINDPNAYEKLGNAMHANSQIKFYNFKNYIARVCDNNPDNPRALMDATEKIVKNPENTTQIIKKAAQAPTTTSAPSAAPQTASTPATVSPEISASTRTAPSLQRVVHTNPSVSPIPTAIGQERDVYQSRDTRSPPPRPTSIPGAASTVFRTQQGPDSQPLTQAVVGGFTNPRGAKQPLFAALQRFFHEIVITFSGGGQTSIGNDPTHGLTRQMAAITSKNPVVTALDPESGKPTVSGPAATIGTIAPAADSDPATNASRFKQQMSVGYNLGVGSA